MLVFTLEHELDLARAPTAIASTRTAATAPEAYVRKALAEADFEVIEIEKASLRLERTTYVDGLVVSARAVGRVARHVLEAEP
jgi:predicted TPR repeat methyltransferase